MIFRVLHNEGAGCLSYLLGCEREGLAVVVDPGRADVDHWGALLGARRLRLAYVLETHVHADHVSGNRELAARTGAPIGLHEAAGVRFPHQPLADGQRLGVGSLELEVLHTPGHTPESACFLVRDTSRGPDPWFVLTGDTLFVGDVGRPDFGGEAAAAELYRSLFHRLLRLDDALEVYPAHGAGSICGRSMSGKVGSTIGFERRFNAALRHAEPDAFVRALMRGLPPRPPTMDQIIARNRGLLDAARPPRPPRLAPRELGAHLEAGAVLVDLRHPQAFGARHVAGSLNVWVESPQLAERVAWFVPAEVPVVLLAATEEDVAQALAALGRIGFDAVAGYVVGEDAPAASGLPLGELPTLSPPELARRLAVDRELLVVDVRDPHEWDEGHIPGAHHLPLRQVEARAAELPRDRGLALVCRGGPRSSTAASALLRLGFRRVLNVWGGMAGWVEAGLPVTRG